MEDYAWPKSEDEFCKCILKVQDGRKLIIRLNEVCKQIDSILYSWPKSEDEFISWFWIGDNGCNLLKKLQPEVDSGRENAWPKNKSEFQKWFWDNDNGYNLIRKLLETASEIFESSCADSWPSSQYEFVSTWFWKNKQHIFMKLQEASSSSVDQECNYRDQAVQQNDSELRKSYLKDLMRQFCEICDEIDTICRHHMWPKSEDDFLVWFWSGDNGNGLIKRLNRVPGQDSRIRREKIIPKIYALLIDDNGVEMNGQLWKLCKVGSTGQEGDKRISFLIDEISNLFYLCGTRLMPCKLFVLPVSATDTSRLIDTESRIRRQVGESFNKRIAERINLPAHTEWVCTTQNHIELIRAKFKEFESKNKDAIDIFDIGDIVPPTIDTGVHELLEQRYRVQSFKQSPKDAFKFKK